MKNEQVCRKIDFTSTICNQRSRFSRHSFGVQARTLRNWQVSVRPLRWWYLIECSMLRYLTSRGMAYDDFLPNVWVSSAPLTIVVVHEAFSRFPVMLLTNTHVPERSTNHPVAHCRRISSSSRSLIKVGVIGPRFGTVALLLSENGLTCWAD